MTLRHPVSFRSSFCDALALCHAESVYLAAGGVPARAPMVGDFVVDAVPSDLHGTGFRRRFVSVRGQARRALAMEFCAALDASPIFWGGREPRSGVHYSLAYEWLTSHDNGGPRVAEYFLWRTGTPVHAESGIQRVPGIPPASGNYTGTTEAAAALVAEAWSVWQRLDAQVFEAIDSATAAAARAAVMDARAAYVAALNARHGAGAYA